MTGKSNKEKFKSAEYSIIRGIRKISIFLGYNYFKFDEFRKNKEYKIPFLNNSYYNSKMYMARMSELNKWKSSLIKNYPNIHKYLSE